MRSDFDTASNPVRLTRSIGQSREQRGGRISGGDHAHSGIEYFVFAPLLRISVLDYIHPCTG